MKPFTPPDYELTTLLGETPLINLWLAEQVSVRRKVIIEQLLDTTPQMRDGFFAMVRAKATMDHPLVASVIEAVNDQNHCFYAREWLPGRSLEEIASAGETFSPAKVAHLLKRIAESQIHNEQRATATTPLSLRDVFLDDQNVMRLANLATSGARSDETSPEDLKMIGLSLPPIVRLGASGASRVTTLLGWMTGTVSENVVDWKDVRHYADQIEQQLASAAATLAKPIAATAKQPKKSVVVPWLMGGAMIAAATVGIVLFTDHEPEMTEVKKATLPIKVAAGSYPGPNGTPVNLREFWLSAHEVTIQEYKDFLDSMAQLTSEQRKELMHENQPAEKINYNPEAWDEILDAASKNRTWNGRPLSLQSPIFHVDWWDAYTYCEWKRGRLPSQEEWGAALRMSGADPAALQVLTWSDVTLQDTTPAGFTGMAGGVKEWTRRTATNPTNPLAPGQWLLCGASSSSPKGGALQCTYLEERSSRNDDFGFRVAYDHEPSQK